MFTYGSKFLLAPYHRQRTKRLIKSPKLYFSDTGLLCLLMGFTRQADLASHPLSGAVWENFVVAETRKRLQALSRRPALWFWRTAQGDEVDLLVEVGPERFLAFECKAAERVTTAAAKGITRFRDEYGPKSTAAAAVVCRTETAYPLDVRGLTAVPVGGPDGLLERLDPTASST